MLDVLSPFRERIKEAAQRLSGNTATFDGELHQEPLLVHVFERVLVEQGVDRQI